MDIEKPALRIYGDFSSCSEKSHGKIISSKRGNNGYQDDDANATKIQSTQSKGQIEFAQINQFSGLTEISFFKDEFDRITENVLCGH